MKDHEIAQLVTSLTKIAQEFHGSQQLRQQISNLLVPVLQEYCHDALEATDEMIDAACSAVPDLFRVDAMRAIEAALAARDA